MTASITTTPPQLLETGMHITRSLQATPNLTLYFIAQADVARLNYSWNKKKGLPTDIDKPKNPMSPFEAMQLDMVVSVHSELGRSWQEIAATLHTQVLQVLLKPLCETIAKYVYCPLSTDLKAQVPIIEKNLKVRLQDYVRSHGGAAVPERFDPIPTQYVVPRFPPRNRQLRNTWDAVYYMQPNKRYTYRMFHSLGQYPSESHVTGIDTDLPSSQTPREAFFLYRTERYNILLLPLIDDKPQIDKMTMISFCVFRHQGEHTAQDNGLTLVNEMNRIFLSRPPQRATPKITIEEEEVKRAEQNVPCLNLNVPAAALGLPKTRTIISK